MAHRMRTEDFVPIFELRKRLLPKPTDLSYYNWETQLSTSNSTPHYQVIADSAQGLLFKNKRDRKIVNGKFFLWPVDEGDIVCCSES